MPSLLMAAHSLKSWAVRCQGEAPACCSVPGCLAAATPVNVQGTHVQNMQSWSAASMHRFELQQLLSERVGFSLCGPHALPDALRFLCRAGCLGNCDAALCGVYACCCAPLS